MRRSSLASSQFKPPRSINTSLSSAGKEGEDGMEHLRDWEGIKTVKRMRMSTDSPEAASLKPDDGCSTSDAADKNITDLTATNITADHGEGESHTSISPVSTTPLPLENSLEFASTGWMTVTQTPIRSNESRISRSPSTPWFLIPAKIGSQMEGSITPRTSDSHRGSHSRIPTPKVNAETIEELMAEKEQLEAEIKELEGRGNKAEDLDDYMELLHQYNNAKDIAQCLMGELALRSGTTLRQVADNIGAPTEDD